MEALEDDCCENAGYLMAFQSDLECECPCHAWETMFDDWDED
jgi:hypothetical protein